ncbi:MAG: AfsR/SARP family transcriptional regulator [Anaerolineae bacterium]
MLALSHLPRASQASKICLVIDGCNRLEDPHLIQEFSQLLRRATDKHSAIVVTCRAVRSDTPLDPAQAWAVGEEDLRFSLDDVARLQSMVGDGAAAASPAHFLERFGGHPALTSLMLRHVHLDEEATPPRDLVWHADRLVARLSNEALVPLYAASLLREDAVSAISECVREHIGDSTWNELRSLFPLLLIRENASERQFRVHAVLRDSVCRLAPTRLGNTLTSRCRRAVLERLYQAQAFSRIERILESECQEAELAEWCERCGPQLLRFSGPEAIERVMRLISAELLSGSSPLLLLRATVLRDQERYPEARTAAMLAAGLADAQGLTLLWARCLLMAARLDLDAARLDDARETLSQLAVLPAPQTELGIRQLAEVQLAIAESMGGDLGSGIARAGTLAASLGAVEDMGSDDAVALLNGLAAIEGVCSGDWRASACLLTRLDLRVDLSPSQRVLVRANLAACYLELGSLAKAKALLDEVIGDCEAARLHHLAAHAYGTRSSVHFGLGDEHQGRHDYQCCAEALRALGHADIQVAEQLHGAVALRALGYGEEALALAEEANLVVRKMGADCLTPTDSVQIEMAASLLFLGDEWAARRLIDDVRSRPELRLMKGHAIRADLVLAEASRRLGDTSGASELLQQHEKYLCGGSANWSTAMYVRAFPGLLGVLAKAIGAEHIPLRMLLMIPLDTIEQGLVLSKEYLSTEEAITLGARRGSTGGRMERLTMVGASPLVYPCHVRLFGGLEVTTDLGIVSESSWRKRKARLMFIMLVLRQHQDVPRDVLLERLWPDMDEEHAKRNFYVTWSTMKRALACGGAPSDASEFVQCSGGVCRVGRHVRSDLDDFDEAVAALRLAAAARDAESAVREARRLVHIYRGELLPGDLYEEWFAEVRERAKHDFCDAMMSAASLAESCGEAEAALLFLRRASAADPWREDVYQATMRCQMNTGQRSRAIETYLSCRSRLTEDLGIDPSVETTRLYQAVLALEDEGTCG